MLAASVAIGVGMPRGLEWWQPLPLGLTERIVAGVEVRSPPPG